MQLGRGEFNGGGAYYLKSSMKTIYVALDARLLRATDRAARRANLSRSALIRNVLSEHLRTLAIHRLEAQDRKAINCAHKGARNCLVGNGPLCGHVDPLHSPSGTNYDVLMPIAHAHDNRK